MPTPTGSSEKGSFPVAVKALVREANKLLILHDIFGDWDLPGGRLLPSEFTSSLHSVLDRKITEELGSDIEYRIDGLDTYFKVERIEHDTGNLSQIFGIGFTATFLGGEIQLGPHHDRFEWVDLATFKPADYFQHGWETGLQRYLDLQQ